MNTDFLDSFNRFEVKETEGRSGTTPPKKVSEDKDEGFGKDIPPLTRSVLVSSGNGFARVGPFSWNGS